MLRGIVAVGVAIFALMVAVKDGRVLRAAGLRGSCTVTVTNADGTQVEACKPGWLEGAPDLTKHGCVSQGGLGQIVYWHCPAALVGQPGS